jgi:hypothetical protein
VVVDVVAAAVFGVEPRFWHVTKRRLSKKNRKQKMIATKIWAFGSAF